MDQRKKRALKGLLILLMSFIALCIIYGYPHIFFLRPQSVHTWRQTDGASLMLNYYHDGLNFFQPRLHHQEGTNGKTVAEFPITYYLGAVACKIFGFREGFTRVVSLLFFLLGIIGMYGIVFLYTQSLFYSICIALFLFASPVEAYYAFNFLPDSTATGAMLMGTLFLLMWHKYGQKYLLIPFVIFFGIAGMIKITALYPLLAYLATGVTLLIQNGSKLLNFCKKNIPFIISCLIIAGISVLWLAWSTHYKNLSGSEYFLQTIVPFAKYNANYNAYWYDVPFLLVKNFWWKFIPKIEHLTLLLFIYLMIKYRKSDLKPVYWFSTFLFLAAASIFLLFYYQFIQHDYYAVLLIPVASVIFITGVLSIKAQNNHTLNVISTIVLLLSLITSVYSAKKEVDYRYGHPKDYTDTPQDFFTITPYLRSIGITQDDLILSPDDYMPNTTLYLMDNRGFTNYFLCETEDRYNIAWKKGARFMAIWKKETLHKPFIKTLHPDSIGTYGSVMLYRLRKE